MAAMTLVMQKVFLKPIEAVGMGMDDMVDMRILGYSPSELRHMLTELESSGRRGLRRLIVADFGLGAIYAMLLATLTARALRLAAPNSSAWDWLILVPFGAMLADWGEGALGLRNVSGYPDITDVSARAGSAVTRLKWILLIASFATPVVLFGVGIARTAGSRRRA
jgi:hypothetical protein